jgi:DNA-binding NtrC family response regulator
MFIDDQRLCRQGHEGRCIRFSDKPFDSEVVVGSINKAVEAHRRRKNMQSSWETVREQYRLEQFIGTSEPIRRVLEFVAKVADSEPIKRLAK